MMNPKNPLVELPTAQPRQITTAADQQRACDIMELFANAGRPALAAAVIASDATVADAGSMAVALAANQPDGADFDHLFRGQYRLAQETLNMQATEDEFVSVCDPHDLFAK